jgi:hypothetical protein
MSPVPPHTAHGISCVPPCDSGAPAPGVPLLPSRQRQPAQPLPSMLRGRLRWPGGRADRAQPQCELEGWRTADATRMVGTFVVAILHGCCMYLSLAFSMQSPRVTFRDVPLLWCIFVVWCCDLVHIVRP